MIGSQQIRIRQKERIHAKYGAIFFDLLCIRPELLPKQKVKFDL
jgi:hypothetical protein